MTIVRMSPILLTPVDQCPDPGLYPCPVFRTAERGGAANLALVLHLPITGPVSTWVERGVALTIEKQVGRAGGLLRLSLS